MSVGSERSDNGPNIFEEAQKHFKEDAVREWKKAQKKKDREIKKKEEEIAEAKKKLELAPVNIFQAFFELCILFLMIFVFIVKVIDIKTKSLNIKIRNKSKPSKIRMKRE